MTDNTKPTKKFKLGKFYRVTPPTPGGPYMNFVKDFPEDGQWTWTTVDPGSLVLCLGTKPVPAFRRPGGLITIMPGHTYYMFLLPTGVVGYISGPLFQERLEEVRTGARTRDC